MKVDEKEGKTGFAALERSKKKGPSNRLLFVWDSEEFLQASKLEEHIARSASVGVEDREITRDSQRLEKMCCFILKCHRNF